MNIKLRIWLSVYTLLFCVPASAAPAHILSMHGIGGSSYIVEISYDANACNDKVNIASSIEVVGNQIQIQSLALGPQPCVGPLPTSIAHETAAIGILSPGNYGVTWSQEGSFSISEEFIIDGDLVYQAVNPIPSNSFWSLFLLLTAMIVFGVRKTVRR